MEALSQLSYSPVRNILYFKGITPAGSVREASSRHFRGSRGYQKSFDWKAKRGVGRTDDDLREGSQRLNADRRLLSPVRLEDRLAPAAGQLAKAIRAIEHNPIGERFAASLLST
jgi:hypothetical protein